MGQKVTIVSGPYPDLIGRTATVVGEIVPRWESPYYIVTVKIKGTNGKEDQYYDLEKQNLCFARPGNRGYIGDGLFVTAPNRGHRGKRQKRR